MNTPTRLVLFDVDGTLVDSEASIVGAMAAAFGAVGLPVPARAEILGIVGLSLDHAMARLAGAHDQALRDRLVEGYRQAYHADRLRIGAAGAPLYPGARAMLDHLAAQPGVLLGIATGKSRRGLLALLEMHGLGQMFVTRQVADDHPSKPHPSMILAALAETGAEVGDTVMVGDTSYDMDMARAAGVAAIGVNWGYHAPDRLGAANHLIDRFEELPGALGTLWKAPA